MDPDKVQAIMNTPTPSTVKALRQFLGQIRRHSQMLRHLANFATPLYAVVHSLPFQCYSIEEEAYQSLKLMLSHASVIQPPDWSQPFHVFVDASDIAIGSAFMQCTPPNWYQSVYYASRHLSAPEKNYSTTEREALGMVYIITKFQHYLLGRRFTFHVDHSALLYLVNKQALTGRLARWMLLLQEFDFQIHHRPGVQHTVANYLSRLELGEPADSTYDDLPDANLFSLTTTTTPDENEDEWIRDMTHFLSTGLPPDHLPLDARKWLAVRSRNFCLITNTLYHKGSDCIWHRAVRQFEKHTIL